VANVEPEPPIIVASVAAGAAAGGNNDTDSDGHHDKDVEPRDEADDVEEMVKGASVCASKQKHPRPAKLPFDATARRQLRRLQPAGACTS
jgi:hypothetical protein